MAALREAFRPHAREDGRENSRLCAALRRNDATGGADAGHLGAIDSHRSERAFVRAYARAQKVACSCKRTWSIGPVIAEL